MRILGLSAFYHDSAASLVDDGKIVAAAQEERFTRIKHDSAFPSLAIDYCLSEAGVTLNDVDFVAFYDKPFLKFERLLETYLAFAPKGYRSFQAAMPVWIKEKLFQKHHLTKALAGISPDFDATDKVLFAEHHQSHAASAFYASPFEEATVLTLDGVGEWATSSLGVGRGNKLEILGEINFPHSVGLLYSAFTYYLGFKVNSGEYKVMGLAPYGEPKYAQKIFDHLIDVKEDGSFRLDQTYFEYCTGLRMTNDRFSALFGEPVRNADQPLRQIHMDLAASVQKVTEEIMLRLVRSATKKTGIRNLCLAGGVALNCVANGKILGAGIVDNIWIQPAAGDAGGSLGAALTAYHHFLDQPRVVDGQNDLMSGAYLGPDYSQTEIETRLAGVDAVFTTLDEDQTAAVAADALADGKAVGWFQGRMEYGPRSLGNRSILGDPRSPSMQSVLNLKVKYRESFRPFAPSVLSEDVAEWFEIDNDSPYMLLVANVSKERCREMTEDEQSLFGIEKLNVPRSDIPAVTHVDFSARVQTVHKETNPRYHALINAFKQRTDCPVVVNTSFNVRGEPIVCTPEDAFRCFMGTDIETLVVGDCVMHKEDQDPALRIDYKNSFALD
jgi:carbamoyltransferase